MSKQHYLPASFVGRFSLGRERRLRDRSVWVQRFGREPYRASASYVAHARSLYENETDDGSIDQSWAYEPRLPGALDALADPSRPLDGRVWAQVLVPFISSLFIRGVDFEKRYTARIPGITGPSTDGSPDILPSWHDNALGSAMIEWQRLLAPTMAAQWIVLHGSGAPILPTNDVAHCLTSPPGEPRRVAYSFPLDPCTMLVLEGRLARRVLDWDGQQWTAPVEHRPMVDAELLTARRALQHGAVCEVYGPTLDSVQLHDADFQPEVGPVGPHFLLPSPRMRGLIPYLEDYFRVLTTLERGWEGAGGAEIDWEVVAPLWNAPVQIAVNVPTFPGGLAVCGRSLYLDLTRFTIDDVMANVGKTPVGPISTEPSPTLHELLAEEGAVPAPGRREHRGRFRRGRRRARSS